VSEPSSVQLYELFALNIVLQMFDGVATYTGVVMGWHEANPLLRHTFTLLGVGPTLLLFKAQACGLLLLLHRGAPRRLQGHVFRGLAAIYCVLSLAPWTAKFFALFTRAL
jgi:hypothetical protein